MYTHTTGTSGSGGRPEASAHILIRAPICFFSLSYPDTRTCRPVCPGLRLGSQIRFPQASTISLKPGSRPGIHRRQSMRVSYPFRKEIPGQIVARS